jgi:hypothetical protein
VRKKIAEDKRSEEMGGQKRKTKVASKKKKTPHRTLHRSQSFPLLQLKGDSQKEVK